MCHDSTYVQIRGQFIYTKSDETQLTIKRPKYNELNINSEMTMIFINFSSHQRHTIYITMHTLSSVLALTLMPALPSMLT